MKTNSNNSQQIYYQLDIFFHILLTWQTLFKENTKTTLFRTTGLGATLIIGMFGTILTSKKWSPLPSRLEDGLFLSFVARCWSATIFASTAVSIENAILYQNRIWKMPAWILLPFFFHKTNRNMFLLFDLKKKQTPSWNKVQLERGRPKRASFQFCWNWTNHTFLWAWIFVFFCPNTRIYSSFLGTIQKQFPMGADHHCRSKWTGFCQSISETFRRAISVLWRSNHLEFGQKNWNRAISRRCLQKTSWNTPFWSHQICRIRCAPSLRKHKLQQSLHFFWGDQPRNRKTRIFYQKRFYNWYPISNLPN